MIGTTSNHNAHGIAVYGTAATPITGIYIDSNEIYYCILGYSESLTLDGNIDGFVISNNVVHDNNNIGILMAGGYNNPSPISAAVDRARNGICKNNVVFNISSKNNPAYGGSLGANGIYCDGCGHDVVVNNIIFNCDYGMEVTSELPNWFALNVTTEHNIIYNSNLNAISIGGYDAQRGFTNSCYFYNNLFYINDVTESGGGEFFLAFNPIFNVINNNTFVPLSTQGIVVSTGTFTAPSSNSFDYNTFIGSSLQWDYNKNSYTSLAAWTSATGKDTHSSSLATVSPLCSMVTCDVKNQPQFSQPCTSSLSTTSSSSVSATTTSTVATSSSSTSFSTTSSVVVTPTPTVSKTSTASKLPVSDLVALNVWLLILQHFIELVK